MILLLTEKDLNANGLELLAKEEHYLPEKMGPEHFRSHPHLSSTEIFHMASAVFFYKPSMMLCLKPEVRQIESFMLRKIVDGLVTSI